MLENLGIVQLEAWDAPGEDLERAMALARRRLGGVTLLEWIARRVTDAELLDGTIVLLPGDEHGPAASLAALVPPDVPVYFAGGAAPLSRLAQALAAYPSRGVVTVGVSSRMVDPHQIDQLIIAAREHVNCKFLGFQAATAAAGEFPRWCRTEALARLAMNMASKNGSQRPSPGDFANFEQHWIPLSAREESMGSPQTLACEEGWEYTETIFEQLGPDSFDGRWVADRPHAARRPKANYSPALPVGEPST